MNFPIYTTKTNNVTKKFDLNTPAGRKEYFDAKIGNEIEDIKNYIDQGNTFLGFLLAKKSAGKGTYSSMFEEIIGKDRIGLIGVGQLIKNLHKEIENDSKAKQEIMDYLEEHYRGYVSPNDALDSILSRSTEKISVPSELIITLIKREISKHPNKGLFVDGFPRTHDQVSYSLFFRDIMGMRNDTDFFVLIDICESIIDERIKYRVECPICKTPRNTKLFPTQFVEYNAESDTFKLLCDNPSCKGYGKQVMQPKEGDELGINAIRSRLQTDFELMKKANLLHGIPKVTLRNHIPVAEANKFDDYEITPAYSYEYDKEKNVVITKETPWVVEDDYGTPSYSLQAPAGVISMVKQIHKILLGNN